MSDGSIPGATELIEKWRERGLVMCPELSQPYNGWDTQAYAQRPIGAVLLRCADELEALVRSSLSQPAGPEGSMQSWTFQELSKNDDEKTFARSHQHDDSGTAPTEREK